MKKTRRLVMLAIALVLTFAMATTTTFAWFTTGDVATVRGIEGRATPDGEGLLISNTAGGVFRAYYQFPTMNLNFKAVTPGTALTGKEVTAPVIGTTLLSAINFYNAAGTPLTADGAPTNIPTDGHAYFQQTFYFRSDVAMTVALTNIEVTVTASDSRVVKTPIAIPANTFGDHDAYIINAEIPANIINALRIGVFSNEGKLVAVYSFAETGNWDAGANAGILTGYNGKTMSYVLYKEIIGEEPITSTGLASTSAISGTDIASPITAVTLAQTGGGGFFEGFATVVIWVEGTDGDCINSILLDAIDVELVFSGTAVVVEP